MLRIFELKEAIRCFRPNPGVLPRSEPYAFCNDYRASYHKRNIAPHNPHLPCCSEGLSAPSLGKGKTLRRPLDGKKDQSSALAAQYTTVVRFTVLLKVQPAFLRGGFLLLQQCPDLAFPVQAQKPDNLPNVVKSPQALDLAL
jgi:hypothetical protein